jgi:hypothetical protein
MSNPIFLGPGKQVQIQHPKLSYPESNPIHKLSHGDVGVVIKYIKTCGRSKRDNPILHDHKYLVKFDKIELEVFEEDLYW